MTIMTDVCYRRKYYMDIKGFKEISYDCRSSYSGIMQILVGLTGRFV